MNKDKDVIQHYSAIKKNKIMPFTATWMGLESVILILREVSQKDKDKQIPCNITFMWNLKYDTNEHICETETDSKT